jgi:hypothetical protein
MMSLAARTHIERVSSFHYHRPVPAPLARVRSRVHTRRARIHVAAARRNRVLGATLAPVNNARLSRPFCRAHPFIAVSTNSARDLLCYSDSACLIPIT